MYVPAHENLHSGVGLQRLDRTLVESKRVLETFRCLGENSALYLGPSTFGPVILHLFPTLPILRLASVHPTRKRFDQPTYILQLSKDMQFQGATRCIN